MISPVTASVSSLRFASSGVRWLDISVKPTRSDWASVCQWTWWNGETDMDLYGNMKVRQLTMEWTMKWNMEGNYIYDSNGMEIIFFSNSHMQSSRNISAKTRHQPVSCRRSPSGKVQWWPCDICGTAVESPQPKLLRLHRIVLKTLEMSIVWLTGA